TTARLAGAGPGLAGMAAAPRLAADLRDVTKLLKGEENPAGRGPGQHARLRHRGQRHHRLARPEGPDHIEAPGDRLNEVWAVVPTSQVGLLLTEPSPLGPQPGVPLGVSGAFPAL